MSSSSELMNKRRKYYAFKEEVSTLSRQIKSIVDEMEKTQSKVTEAYLIDEENGDGFKLKNLCSSLRERYKILTSHTIPAIDSKISSLSREIDLAVKEESSIF